MDLIINNLEKIEKDIQDVLSEINVLENSAYYDKFNRNEDKEIDIFNLRLSLKEYYSAKFSILETLELEIKKEKIKISDNLKQLLLKKTA